MLNNSADLKDIERMLSTCNKVLVKYRDQYNFIVKGILLKSEILSDDKGQYLIVDNYSNKVYLSKVISVISL